MQQALEAVENMTPEADCITERQTPSGYWWRYTHSADEPDQTLVGAIKVAAYVAEQEAQKAGKTFIVATSSKRWPDVYVFAHDHPDAQRLDLNTMYEIMPTGELIQHGSTRH
jgi:hypothetical protein